MSNWFVNNPFFLLLVPLVGFILCCTYMHWPCSLEKAEPLGVVQGDTVQHLYQLRLLSSPDERARSWRYEAQVLDGLSTHPKVYLYLQKDSTCSMPNQGDTLLAYTRFQQPDSLGEFDYAAYLHRQGISGTGYVDRHSWRLAGANQRPWWQSAQAWQQRLLQRYQELGIQSRELGTIAALTLGYREDLDRDVKQQFSASGAMHVLAVSGLHTNILQSALMALITLFGLFKPLYEQRTLRAVQAILVMAMLIAYAWLTGATPSVVRSVVMCCMMLLALVFYRREQMLNTMMAAAFLILLFRPMDLFAVSFQLSFAAVIAIILFADGWNNMVPKIHCKGWKKILRKVGMYLFGLLGMSLAAQIGTMPVSLYYFGQISNYFMLTNMIVLPLAWLMMMGGLLTLTIGWWTPLGKLLAWLLNGLTWLMNESVGWIESLPGSTTNIVLSPWMMVALIGINLIILIAWKQVTTLQLKWK